MVNYILLSQAQIGCGVVKQLYKALCASGVEMDPISPEGLAFGIQLGGSCVQVGNVPYSMEELPIGKK